MNRNESELIKLFQTEAENIRTSNEHGHYFESVGNSSSVTHCERAMFEWIDLIVQLLLPV